MNKETVKKGYELAEKELEEKQVAQVKEIVKSTLNKIKSIDEEIDGLKSEIKELEEKKKILRLDIDDLKEGRLDRIEERQATDVKTKKISVIIVEKVVHHHHYDRWYEPYKITYVPYYPSVPAIVPQLPVYGGSSPDYISLCNTSDMGTPVVALNHFAMSTTSGNNSVFTVNGSLVKNNVVGTYSIGDKTVHLR